MTDRELLELAAKAIGYEFRYNLYPAGQLFKNGQYVRFWDALEKDEDCMRMETALNIEIMWCGDHVNCGSGAELVPEFFKDHDGDKNKARRYASVRAAAEIGKSMP